tara:strand:- start:1023 stop:1355 length:333 start_codon:yes stop_codon:yes gene_type:complete
MNKIISKRKISKSKSILTPRKQFFKGIVFLIFFCLTIIFIFGDHGVLKLYKIKNERKLIQKKIAQLREEKEILKNEKIRMENDLGYLEKIAREKYKMVKPGEKIFKVIND